MFDNEGLRYIPDNLVADNLKDIIEQRCKLQPGRLAINFLHDGELDSQDSKTYSELDASAKSILYVLRSYEIQKGDRAILLFSAGNLFLQSFVACLYGGVVAVPVAFPGRRDIDWERVFGIVRDCGASVILSSGDNLTKVEERFSKDFSEWKGAFVDVAEIRTHTDLPMVTAEVNANDLAFLQYTSGSTGAPKGVMVNHGNLLHNQRVLQTGFKNDGNTRYVSWLPLFHDMGLIGCALQSLYLGVTFNYMAPASFLQQPLRWIKTIHHFRATTSGAPNFAYELCAARYSAAECHDLDLTSWQCAFNGAEPIRTGTLELFQHTYAQHGLQKTAQFPCYGLAEGVLMVSGTSVFAEPTLLSINSQDYLHGVIKLEPNTDSVLVGVGKVVGDQEIVIVNAANCQRAQPGTIGEIWLHGRSVAQGYWGKTEATKETFKAKLFNENNEKYYLRTGDSGYLDEQGELYITGRIKDTIIINGKNYFPQDIELIVEQSHESLKPGGGAAFSIEHDGRERIVIVHEIKRTHLKTINAQDIIKVIRQRIASECELNVFDVCLLKPTTLLKTTSGKVQRQQNKKAYLNNELHLLTRHLKQVKAPATEKTPALSQENIFQHIQLFLREQLCITTALTADDLFVDAGLTSVDVVALAEHLSEVIGERVDASLFWDYPEIGSFCSALAQQLAYEEDTPAAVTPPLATDIATMDDAEFHALLEKELA
jgi:acyl-CoA synthetase (AMP-forming)/AMP-acid ligase II